MSNQYVDIFVFVLPVTLLLINKSCIFDLDLDLGNKYFWLSFTKNFHLCFSICPWSWLKFFCFLHWQDKVNVNFGAFWFFVASITIYAVISLWQIYIVSNDFYKSRYTNWCLFNWIIQTTFDKFCTCMYITVVEFTFVTKNSGVAFFLYRDLVTIFVSRFSND